MLLLTLNFKKKRLPFPFLERATSCVLVSLLLLRLGLCTLGHPSHAGHRARSSARLPLSISLFGPVRPCVPLKTTSSIGPISVGLALPKRKAGPFLRSAAAIPAGVFAPCSAGSARISLAHGRILSKLRFGFSAPPVFPCANRLCFLGSVPSLGFGGARFARFRFSILDVPFGVFHCSHPAALFPDGVCVHALSAPEALAVVGFYADFGSVDSALRNAFPFPNSRWIWNRALQTFGSWGHPVGCRWTENPCVPVFLRGPSFPGASAPLSSVSAFARRNSAPRVSEKAGLWKKSSRRVFCLVSRGPPPRLCRHCARGGDLSAMPVSFNCRVLPIFWMLRPARFPGLCPCAFRPSRPRRKSSDFRVSS